MRKSQKLSEGSPTSLPSGPCWGFGLVSVGFGWRLWSAEVADGGGAEDARGVWRDSCSHSEHTVRVWACLVGDGEGELGAGLGGLDKVAAWGVEGLVVDESGTRCLLMSQHRSRGTEMPHAPGQNAPGQKRRLGGKSGR